MKFIFVISAILLLSGCETLNKPATMQDFCREIFAAGGKDDKWLQECLKNPAPAIERNAREQLNAMAPDKICLVQQMNDFPNLASEIAGIIKNRKINCDIVLRSTYSAKFRNIDAPTLCQAIYDGSTDDALIDAAKAEISRRGLNCAEVLKIQALNDAATAQREQARAALFQSMNSRRMTTTNCTPDYIGGMSCTSY